MNPVYNSSPYLPRGTGKVVPVLN